MNTFSYTNGTLQCEQVELGRIADDVGTPCYVYSYTTILENFRRIQRYFSSIDPLIAYSVKANSNGAVLRALAREGAAFDVVSGGELQRVIEAGGSAGNVIFAGVGKSSTEIEQAITHDILMFNVESLPEAYRIDEIARVHGKRVRVALRINPDVNPKTHKYITTGKKENKFGISWDWSEDIAREVAALKNISLVGLHAHIGSQITDPQAHILAVERLRDLIKSLRSGDIEIHYLNIGGGYGIAYREGDAHFKMEALATRVIPLVRQLGCRLIMEPGRWVVGAAGCLLTHIMYIKPGHGKHFVIVDAAFNDLIRPALYDAYHEIKPALQKEGDTVLDHADVVGPVCESGDFIGKDRTFHNIAPGDVLCVMDTGAYGFVMASQYNSRPRPPEVLVKESDWYVIRERESMKDITRSEKVPGFLQ